MNLKCLLISLLFLFIVNKSFSQSTYSQYWKKVNAFEGAAKPKSALALVENVYTKAKNEKNSPQIIKSIIYKLKYKNLIKDNSYAALIQELDSIALKADFPDNAIMHSMLADMYWQYFQQNYILFLKRTNMDTINNADIQTWPLNLLIDKTIKEYQLSLIDKEKLQTIPLSDYSLLINPGTKPKELRPTLYDFLANKALNFFSNTQADLINPINFFNLNEDYYFSDADDFVQIKIQTKDTLSLLFHAVTIYQDLLNFRLTKKDDENALIDIELSFFKFVYNRSLNANKEELYINALNRLEKKYASNPSSAEISYEMAWQYYQASKNYIFSREETHKYITYKKTAYNICKKVIEKYPNSKAAEYCKQLINNDEFHNSNLSFEIETAIPSKNKFLINLNYQNMDTVFIRIAKIDRDTYKSINENISDPNNRYDKILNKAKPVREISQILPDNTDFDAHTAEVIMDKLPVGFYIIFVANNKAFTYKDAISAYKELTVTDLSYLKQNAYDGSYDYVVLDRTTGHPLEGVSAQTWGLFYDYDKRKYVRIDGEKYITDRFGRINLKYVANAITSNWYVDFFKGTDFCSTLTPSYVGQNYHSKYINSRTYFFTDRKIYRPGQTIYFKGIVIDSDGESNKIIQDQTISVFLYDVNHQQISTLNVKTNEYGTFSGSFKIPKGLLNGNFSIQEGVERIDISVEEYKRPKFEVEMSPFKGNYILNDTVKVKGKALSYSGAAVSEAEVTYNIVRTPQWSGWTNWYYYPTSAQIKNGKIKTNESGEFEIIFLAQPDINYDKNEFISFDYQLNIDVTDVNGETQSVSKSIRVGWRALQINIPVEQLINKDSQQYLDEKTSKIKINTLNLNGEYIPAKGDIKIYKLKDIPVALRKRLWKQPDKYLYNKGEWIEQLPGYAYDNGGELYELDTLKQIRHLKFDTEKDKELDVSFFRELSPGHYSIDITSKDIFGNPVSNKHFFSVYSEKGNKMPYETKDFFVPVKTNCEPGEVAMFLIGSSDKNIRVLYEVEHKGQIVLSDTLIINNEQRLIKIPVEEKHRGNFSVHFVYIKENRIYNHSHTVIVPYTNKKLDLEFITFRDKLQPGENEEWKIKISGPKGEKVAAELLATLYDASLDKFRKNAWDFDIYKKYNIERPWIAETFSFVHSNILKDNYYQNDYYYRIKPLFYDSFNWFGFYIYNQFAYYDFSYTNTELEEVVVVGYGTQKKSNLTGAISSYKDDILEDNLIKPINVAHSEPETGEKDKFSKVNVRTNFNETAFFYPQLQTNNKGDVIVNFTMPESLTKWRMMGLGVTKDLKYGFIENELITQKELMLMPNAPRFFRENDKITFPVKISNVTKNDIKGEINLELFDAFTMEPLDDIFQNKDQKTQKFLVKAEGNSVITWNLEIPEGLGAVTYKVVAKAGKFSDGEQNVIPVLSNRMLVTESLPLAIRENQSKEYKMDKLIASDSSSTLKHHKLTLEFTSNPAWYAVQSIPYLMEYPYECNEQTFSRFFANSLASHIVNSDPKIKKVFDSWANTPNSEALLSNLEKNQELKSLLLEETPWVIQGKTESELKKRVGLLFDLNRMSDELSRALKKLQKGQVSNGGWPWFKGMPEDRYITQYIVSGMGQLDLLGVTSIRQDPLTINMLRNAIYYLDMRITEDFVNLKKDTTKGNMDRNHLSYEAIQYLYARSYFTDISMSNNVKEAYGYYIGQAEKYWKQQNICMQGMIALALHRNGKAKTGIHVEDQIVASLKEFSTYSEEFGMYWKENIGGWYWYNAPIEMQALMIEVFDEIADDQKSVNEMEIWLLKQKQTQNWGTTRATVLATYALLKRGTDLLSSDELVEIKMNGETIDPKKIEGVQIEEGTGYFKTSWNGDEVKPEMGNITITKKDKGVSWGALYWQYFEDLDKITPHETPLKLKKHLFIEKQTDQGIVLEPIIDKNSLKMGDKLIVRIELSVDRQMEYVHMKDMRASGFEPLNVISGYKYQGGLGYYESTKDAATNFFIGTLPKGTFVFEYPLRVTHKGDFSNGITTIQCMYSPEFTSHSEGIRVQIN